MLSKNILIKTTVKKRFGNKLAKKIFANKKMSVKKCW